MDTTATTDHAQATPSPLRAALIDLAPVFAVTGIATACIAHCAFSAGGWSACAALMKSLFM